MNWAGYPQLGHESRVHGPGVPRGARHLQSNAHQKDVPSPHATILNARRWRPTLSSKVHSVGHQSSRSKVTCNCPAAAALGTPASSHNLRAPRPTRRSVGRRNAGRRYAQLHDLELGVARVSHVPQNGPDMLCMHGSSLARTSSRSTHKIQPSIGSAARSTPPPRPMFARRAPARVRIR